MKHRSQQKPWTFHEIDDGLEVSANLPLGILDLVWVIALLTSSTLARTMCNFSATHETREEKNRATA